MKLFLIFLIFGFLISKFDNEKYYIYQYSVIQFNEVALKYNCKCYISTFERFYEKDKIRIQTDSVEYDYFIVKSNGKGTYFLSKESLPYYYKELSMNGDYYLVITPFRFNEKFLYGGDVIAISNKKICE